MSLFDIRMEALKKRYSAARNNKVRKRHIIRELFVRQDGKCYYCSCQMLFLKPYGGQNLPWRTATIEHIKNKDKISDIVLACYKCNQERSRNFKGKTMLSIWRNKKKYPKWHPKHKSRR